MKNSGAQIFIFTVVLFAAGTSAITYSLAKEVTRTNVARKPAPVVVPWYCTTIPPLAPPKPQPENPFKPWPATSTSQKAGYTPGYVPSTPGYIYPTPGYGTPGYLAGYFGDGGSGPTDPGITQYESFVKLGQSCPSGYKPDWSALNTTCDRLLRQRLDHVPTLPADVPKFSACEKKFKPAVWNTAVNTKTCSALRTYKKECGLFQKRGLPCRSIDGYLVPAGVPLSAINGTARDAALYCDTLYPPAR